jgi:hypothetical protein
MVPFIVAQSRESSVSTAQGLLDESRQRDMDFFLKRGIRVPDITASVTGTHPTGTKFTGTPAGAEPPSDSQEDHMPDDVEHDEP